jgi:hypothetical protein
MAHYKTVWACSESDSISCLKLMILASVGELNFVEKKYPPSLKIKNFVLYQEIILKSGKGKGKEFNVKGPTFIFINSKST